MTTLRDQDLPRSVEIVEALAARLGPITLDSQQVTTLIGRLVSLLVSGGAVSIESPPGSREHELATIAMVAGCDGLIGILRLPPEDVKTIVRAVTTDVQGHRGLR